MVWGFVEESMTMFMLTGMMIQTLYGFVAVEVSENVVSIDFVNSQAKSFKSIKVPC